MLDCNGTACQWPAQPEAQTPFSTDPGDELPVGVQLTWRLRALIATGQLAAGDRLPSFRRLAEWAGVNVNTVRAVYEGLEEEGLVVSRQGQGTFVADGIEAAPQLEEIATDALRRAQRGGSQPARPGDRRDGLRQHARHRWRRRRRRGLRRPSLPDLAEASEAIEVRHELRRQIGRLEAELASYARDLPARAADRAPLAPRPTSPGSRSWSRPATR